MVQWTAERDGLLRREAMSWLTTLTHGGEVVHSNELKSFEFEGQRVPLIDAQRGIRKPAALDAALSIRTVYRSEGQVRPYEDSEGSDGFIRYKWRGEDPNHAENRALRAALELQVPLIWFFGVGPGLYKPIYPVYLIGEEHQQQQFVVATEKWISLADADSALEEQIRRYVIRETKQRVHQPVFRATVMRAYGTRCAVCSLGHGELLDAAHIVADSEENGIASVRNGLALCKIHHAAFDANILGIRPDLVVDIRADLLVEVDGPMLQHGLKERHGERLRVVPTMRNEQPDPRLLEQAYERFRAAG